MTTNETGSGKNRLFHDSWLGLLVAGIAFAGLDGALDAAIDAMSEATVTAGDSWWSSLVTGAAGALLGVLTAYKARRNKARGNL